MNKLSVVMIVKNEEAMLGACLESVKDADEIIILDTGSEDGTKEVALKYTDKFFDNEYTWIDHFAGARNAAKEKATGDWILSIDADETLETNGIAKIRKAIETKKQSIDIKMKGGNNTYHVPRLFRNDPDIYWKGAIHETISIVEPNKSDITITYGTSPAHAKDPNRSLRILRKEVDSNSSAIREVYYLAREYTYKKEWEKAIYWFDVYLKRANWKPEKADGFYLLAKSYWAMNRGEEARRACLQALSINANFKAASVLMSQMSWPKNAKRWLEWSESATNEDVLFTRVAASKPTVKKPVKDFLILGHPRCGTKYMAQLFTMLGFPVGHERFEKYGTSSWLYAVDVKVPQWIPSEYDKKDFDYRNTIHVVRHPLDAIASIMLTEDIGKESLNFRRKYVTLFGNPHTIATLSYLSWNKLIQSHDPILTTKVEDAEKTVPSFLIEQNYLDDSFDSWMAFPAKNTNARQHRDIDLEELKSNLPEDLFNTLLDFAEQHDYDL